MLAQLKEAIQQAFFRLVEYLEHQLQEHQYRLKIARNKYLSSETLQSILGLNNEGYSMRDIAKKLKISYNCVLLTEQNSASNQNRKKSGWPRCTTE